jgi:hypothetical protein
LISFLLKIRRKDEVLSLIPDQFSQVSWMIWALCFGLMVVNWGLETWKWRILSQDVAKAGFGQQFKAVLAGMAISTLIPNRMAEYIGRVWFVPKTHRWKAGGRSVVGGLMQMSITLWMGLMAAVVLTETDELNPHLELDSMLMWCGFITLTLLALALVVSFSFRWIKSKFQWKWLGYFEGVSPQKINAIWMLSLARYLVFSLQFLLVYRALVPEKGLFDDFPELAAMFLGQSIIPIPAVLDWTARFEMAQVFSGSECESAAATASLVLWLVNLMIPALVGIILFFFHQPIEEEHE